MQEYELKVQREHKEFLVKIYHKEKNFWLYIGCFKVASNQLFVLDKTECWKAWTDLSDRDTLFGITLEKIRERYEDIKNYLDFEPLEAPISIWEYSA